jgi:flagellar hook-length control protein FliK
VGPLGRALRATTGITRGTRASSANELPQVDPARFVGRVAKAFQTARDRDGTLQLRLSPPELGSLKLQLTVKDGVMTAALETDNANARRVLLEHLPALRDRLAEQNIRVERFDVDVRQENQNGQANPRGSNQNPYQQPQQSEPRRSPAMPQPARETAQPELPSLARISTTGINLVV